jgi:hypothetical protein
VPIQPSTKHKRATWWRSATTHLCAHENSRRRGTTGILNKQLYLDGCFATSPPAISTLLSYTGGWQNLVGRIFHCNSKDAILGAELPYCKFSSSLIRTIQQWTPDTLPWDWTHDVSRHELRGNSSIERGYTHQRPLRTIASVVPEIFVSPSHVAGNMAAKRTSVCDLCLSFRMFGRAGVFRHAGSQFWKLEDRFRGGVHGILGFVLTAARISQEFN